LTELETDGRRRRYGTVTALDGLTFGVPAGQVFWFLGPNGAAKTTTMRAVFGLTTLDTGEIRWRGRPVDAAARRMFIVLGYAFYCTAFAAAGSLVSRQSDVNSTIMPVQLPLIVAYALSCTVSYANGANAFYRVLGFLPPTARADLREFDPADRSAHPAQPGHQGKQERCVTSADLLASAPGMHGRMTGLWTMALPGTQVVNGPLAGWVTQEVGPRGLLAVRPGARGGGPGRIRFSGRRTRDDRYRKI
jgi:energy-coupling factor transporter ATP-binding protein EcfA2